MPLSPEAEREGRTLTTDCDQDRSDDNDEYGAHGGSALQFSGSCVELVAVIAVLLDERLRLRDR